MPNGGTDMNIRKGRTLMVGVGTLAYFFIGIMYVWSVLRIELNEVFPVYTAAQLSMCFTLMMTMFCIGGFMGGKIAQQKTPALSLRLAALLILVGYAGASMTRFLYARSALVMLYIFYSVLGGLGIGIAYNSLITNIAPWFPDKLGLVSGVMMMGMGMSSLIFAFAIELVCPYIGIFNVLLILGICASAVVFVSSFFVIKPDTGSPGGAAEDGGISKTPRQMVASVSFWVFFVWNILSSCCGLLVINSAASIAEYFGLAASLGMVISIFNGCGRPVVGFMIDRLGQFKAMLIINIMLVMAGAMLVISDHTHVGALMFAGMLFLGVAYGGGSTVSSKVIRDLYGPRYYGVNHSISFFCLIVSSFAGPYLSGILQDRSDGGFLSSFYMLLFIALAMLLLWVLLKLSIKRENINLYY